MTPQQRAVQEPTPAIGALSVLRGRWGEWRHALQSLVDRLHDPRRVTVCAYCRRFHTVGGQWQDVPPLMAERFRLDAALVRPGVCEDCAAKLAQHNACRYERGSGEITW